ncbi:MAG TPA: cobalamin-dependent protein [Bacteroidota bacterium]
MQKTILSTADVARLFSVTETTVKRWADEGSLKCQRTPGGHRKFVIKYVIEFAEKNNLEPTGVLQMPEREQASNRLERAILDRDGSVLAQEFVDRVLVAEDPELSDYLSYLYEHKIPLWQIYDEIVREGMREIGDRWERGEIAVDQEHRATYLVLDALSRLQLQIHRKPPNGRAALLACVGEEHHELGLRCASYLFEAEGWQTLYLGARTPAQAVLRAIRELRPAAVCLSATQVGGRTLGPLLKEITTVAHELSAVTILGGRASGARGFNYRSFDIIVSSTRELAEALAQWEQDPLIGGA